MAISELFQQHDSGLIFKLMMMLTVLLLVYSMHATKVGHGGLEIHLSQSLAYKQEQVTLTGALMEQRQVSKDL